MSDHGRKHTARGCELQRERKAEVERVSHTAHTVTSEHDSEMAYSLGKCHLVKSMFQPHASLLAELNSERDICPHTLRGQKKKHQTHCQFVVGSFFIWLPLVS